MGKRQKRERARRDETAAPLRASAVLAGLLLLSGCGAAEPPVAPQLQLVAAAPAAEPAAPLLGDPAILVPPAPMLASRPLAAPPDELHLERKGAVAKVGKPYQVGGRWYYPKHDPDYTAEGKASWYGPEFHGRRTANGELFNMDRLTAAHPTLPLPSYAEVTNLANGRTIVVRINDRGPYKRGRIMDLSKRAAELLGYAKVGTGHIRVRYLRPAPLAPDDSFEMQYLARQPWYRRSVASAAPAVPPPAEAVGDWAASTSPAPEEPPLAMQVEAAPLAPPAPVTVDRAVRRSVAER